MNEHITTTLAKASANLTYASAGGTVLAWLNSAEFWAMIGGFCAIVGAWSTHHHNKKRYRLEEKKAQAMGVVLDSSKAGLSDE